MLYKLKYHNNIIAPTQCKVKLTHHPWPDVLKHNIYICYFDFDRASREGPAGPDGPPLLTDKYQYLLKSLAFVPLPPNCVYDWKQGHIVQN